MSSQRPESLAPPDPAEYRPGGVRYPAWAIAAFGLACAAAGAGLASLTPQLLNQAPVRRAQAASAAQPPAAAPAPVASATLSEPPPPTEVARLAERVSALEQREDHGSRAVAEALAAAALLEATQRTGPFAPELAALRNIAPGAPELASLARLSEVGAPSRAALAETFPEYAARGASASRAPAEGAGLGARARYELSRVISLRRVSDERGSGPDAALARAERLVGDGDLEGALRALDQLPASGREAVAPWRLRAERRAEIDRAAAALRARALSSLASSADSFP
jgi:hypothetical protein